MASDPNKPLLRLTPKDQRDRVPRKPFPPQKPNPFTAAVQRAAFGPKFDRLAQVLARDPSGLQLKGDPNALAPERLLVFEVRGTIQALANAVRNIPGLDLIDEEELSSDDNDKAPAVYLMVPDARALAELLSRWTRWRSGRQLRGDTPWSELFDTLRDLRTWGPQDRVRQLDADILIDEMESAGPEGRMRVEIELVFRKDDQQRSAAEMEVSGFLRERGGAVISSARLPDIAYHALLVDVPIALIAEAVERLPNGIAGVDPIMAIRPQALATRLEVADVGVPSRARNLDELGDPILALLDGVPVAAHPLLEAHVDLFDPFGLEPQTPVVERSHGTAMASLIIHGDRNRDEIALPRRIHVIPVLGRRDEFPPDRLIVDLVYTAVQAMRGPDGSAPNVVIVSLSFGNRRRRFTSQISAWARLIDRLSYELGILFIVSAGNAVETFGISEYTSRLAFEDADKSDRAKHVLHAIGEIVADRRIISPAETVNGLTVGAHNHDDVPEVMRAASRANIDAFGDFRLSNPSSSLGPGFARSVKPEILMPGSKERLVVVDTDPHLQVRPAGAARAFGLKVAAPPRQGLENLDGYTSGTSAATALAARTCHRIYDALEDQYGDEFTNLTHIERAVLLKALIIHPARWPAETAKLIRETIGPHGRHAVHQKDSVRRFIGFGMVDAEDAVACAADRATFWCVGLLHPKKAATISVPIPEAFHSQAIPHTVAATLAWFAPTAPGRKTYRSVKLKLLEPAELAELGVKASSDAPDANQTNRGTVYHRCWTGRKAAVVSANMTVELTVQREPDQGAEIDLPIPYGVAITVAMPGVTQIYDQVRQRLSVPAAVVT